MDGFKAKVRATVEQAEAWRGGRRDELDGEAWYAVSNWPDWRQRAALRAYLGLLSVVERVGRRVFTKSIREVARASVGTVDDVANTETVRHALG